MRNNFLLLLLSFSAILWGQEDTSYKEDQFYFSASYLDVRTNISEFKQFGFSRSFQLGYINDISLVPSGQTALGVGFGYGFDYIISNLNVENTIDASEFSFTSATLLSSKNKYSRHYLSLPIEFRWRTSTADKYDFWRIYGGYKLSYLFLSRIDPFYGRPKNIKNSIDSWQHSLTLSMGFDTWNLNLEYGLTPFFLKETITQEGVPLDLSAFKLGLIFYLL